MPLWQETAEWPNARVEALIARWNNGESALEIAKAFGPSVTRNSIIAKVDRLRRAGVQLRAKTVNVARPAKPAKPQAPRPVAAEPVVVAPIVEPVEDLQPLPHDQRPEHWCRWPIGDPRSAAFNFCGREQAMASDARRDPYCAAHRYAERERQASRSKSKPTTPNELMRSLRRYL